MKKEEGGTGTKPPTEPKEEDGTGTKPPPKEEVAVEEEVVEEPAKPKVLTEEEKAKNLNTGE